jgi:hypothetical protein
MKPNTKLLYYSVLSMNMYAKIHSDAPFLVTNVRTQTSADICYTLLIITRLRNRQFTVNFVSTVHIGHIFQKVIV